MKGFTLIETLIAFAITAIVAGISIESFGAYIRSQTFGQGVADIVDLLNISRSRSISQVKPQSCGSATLVGYEVRITVAGADYVQNAICGNDTVFISKKKLPDSMTFRNGSSVNILFNVSNGTVTTPGEFVISGYGKTSTINVDSTGKTVVTN